MADDVPGLGSAAGLSFDTPILEFGEDAVEALPAVLARSGVDAPLVVTDEGIESAGILETVLDALAGDPPVHYAATEPSTADFAVPDGNPEGFVAVGGGSCLDTAKLLAALVAHGGEAADYLGVDKVPGPVPPIVALPTTAGTGSQATQTAVVAHEGIKRGASDEFLRPDVALVDPSFTHDLPREITARSGFDAFVHALESLTARDYRRVRDRPINYQGANPVSRPLSRRALGLVHGGLERAIFDRCDREARRMTSLGSHLAGVAFSNAGLGAVHALASTVGGMTGRPHGECLGASVRAGLRYNRPVRREEYARGARFLGAAGDGTATGEAATALIDECDRLRSSIGLPGSLAEVGLGPDDLDAVVEKTLEQERRLTTNPRGVTGDIRGVIAESLE